jgi:hypothetical protein
MLAKVTQVSDVAHGPLHYYYYYFFLILLKYECKTEKSIKISEYISLGFY